MRTDKLLEFVDELTLELNLINLELVFEKYPNDIDAIYRALINAGLDDQSKGFWIWDIQNNKEYYSPDFRNSLGFKNSTDFPNVPESWKNQIHEEDLKIAINNYYKHIESGGATPYRQVVRYRKKEKGSISVMCHGKVMSWTDEGAPMLMIGVHL